MIFLGGLGWLGGLSGQGGCRPTQDIPDDPLAPDLGGDIMPLPPCARGSTRCTDDQGAVEMCDGSGWHMQAVCDTGKGEACSRGQCLLPCERLTAGNVGCSFYPANLWSTSEDGEFGIVASNTSDRLAVAVTLSDSAGPIETKTAMPGGLVDFRLPHGKNKLNQTEQAKKSFHLQATAPVAVYQFHPIDAARIYSGSATLLLPEHVMGRNYFVMSYTYNAELLTRPPQGQGFVAVTALHDNTTVEVTVPVATKSGPGVPALAPGGTLRRTLSRLEVLEVIQVNSQEDISGAIVKASSPVVVFGGAGGVSIPKTAVGGNHLGLQMFPLVTWGKRYVAAKFKQRNQTDRDHYRILASEDMTQVTLSGGPNLPKIAPLLRGQFFEFATDEDFEIVGDKPILTWQYMPAWGNLSGRYSPVDFPDGVASECPFRNSADDVQCIGDANMAPLIPVEQYRDDYIFYVPRTYTYDFINVLAPLGTRLTLDGAQVTEELRPIAGTMLGRAIIRLQTGNHRIQGSAPFGLMGYGYSYATSYSYAGGLNLEKINPVE